MPTGNAFAVTYTVKDEARMLPDALRWYRALGAERFYVFLDGTRDAMRAWLPTQPDVVVCDSPRPAEISDPPSWIGEIDVAWEGFIDARKNLNSWLAARSAADDGFAWLAMIDPDELLLPDPESGPSPEVLEAMLQRVPDRADQLLVRNCDVLAGTGDGTPFGHRYFLERRPLLESIWRPLRKIRSSVSDDPDAAARFDHAFWSLALRDKLPRKLIDPDTGATIPTGYFLSYASHKSIVRLERLCELRPFIHHWERPSGRRRAWIDPTARLLHFDIPDAEQFIHKFSQRRGNREFTPRFFAARRRLTQIASELAPEDAERFFAEQIAVCDPCRIEELEAAGIVLDVPQVPIYFADARRDEA